MSPPTVPAALFHADAAAGDFVRVVIAAGVGALMLVMIIGAVLALIEAAKAEEIARRDKEQHLLLRAGMLSRRELRGVGR